MVSAGERERPTLGESVRERRERLGLTVVEAANRAGVSKGTWISLEGDARRTLPHSYAAIEKALRWAPGSIRAIQQDGQPTPLDADSDTDYDLLVAWLRRVASNPNRSPSLQAWAKAQLEQLPAIKAMDRAEAEARGEAAS